MFKVDTLLYFFSFIIQQLLATANRHMNEAQVQQEIIDKASAAKNFLLIEAKRANTVATKIQALLA